ncbi:toxin glutamine deamidase domain-containing protein [Streptomyces sp. NPDC048650]|uniref:toxin glutamine deamidase domain-containing protein n=1 Tax=Streptomyces sp. NPDC048650 TaxID=3365583 RepID=UPI003720A8B4
MAASPGRASTRTSECGSTAKWRCSKASSPGTAPTAALRSGGPRGARQVLIIRFLAQPTGNARGPTWRAPSTDRTNEDGSFEQAPDPREGTWVDDVRGQNPDDSGRDVDCPDGTLAFTDSYAGNPTVAARRSPNEDGTPADTPEPGGRDRIENTLGAEFDEFRRRPRRVHQPGAPLLDEGHGSQAVIITQNADGRAHACNQYASWEDEK